MATKKETIKDRIKQVFAAASFFNVCKFVRLFCSEFNAPNNVSIEAYFDALSEFIYNAPKETKNDFLGLLDANNVGGLRICSVCGEFMTEGYITAEFDYYCSDKCRLEDYVKYTDGDYGKAEELIAEDFTEDSEDFFYTEW